MFELLMLASFALIIFSRYLPEEQMNDDERQNPEMAEVRMSVKPSHLTPRQVHGGKTAKKQPCLNSFSRAA